MSYMVKAEICKIVSKRFLDEGQKVNKARKFRIKSGIYTASLKVGTKTLIINIHKNSNVLVSVTFRNKDIEIIGFSDSAIIIKYNYCKSPIAIPLKEECRNKPNLSERVKNRDIALYTDGGCIQALGAWSYFIVSDDWEIASNTYLRKETTSYDMEAIAILKGLERLKDSNPKSITVFSDAIHLMAAMNEETIPDGKMKSYVKKYRKLVSTFKCPVHWKWVRSHSTDYWNKQCDKAIRIKFKQYLNN